MSEGQFPLEAAADRLAAAAHSGDAELDAELRAADARRREADAQAALDELESVPESTQDMPFDEWLAAQRLRDQQHPLWLERMRARLDEDQARLDAIGASVADMIVEANIIRLEREEREE